MVRWALELMKLHDFSDVWAMYCSLLMHWDAELRIHMPTDGQYSWMSMVFTFFPTHPWQLHKNDTFFPKLKINSLNSLQF